MLRFMFNFIFFGVLFYVIWMFFPDAFHKLVAWAGKVYEFFVDLGVSVLDSVNHLTKPEIPTPGPMDPPLKP